MIKKFFVTIKGPSLFITLLFLGLGLAIVALSIREYKDYSQQETVASDAAASPVPELSIQDLQSMFDLSTSSSAAEFEIIAQKNLFSQDRRAWKPPPPQRDLEDDRDAAQARATDPKSFRLYGVTFSQNEKIALVYYDQLSGNNKHRLVREGDAVYSERDGRIAYKVLSIYQDKVTLEAGNDSFQISLFGHERREKDTTSRSYSSIVIGGREKTPEDPPRDDPDRSEPDMTMDE